MRMISRATRTVLFPTLGFVETCSNRLSSLSLPGCQTCPGLLVEAARYRVGIGTNMRKCVFHKPVSSITPLVAFLLNFGARLFPRLGGQKQYRCRPGQAADQQTDESVLRVFFIHRDLLDIVSHNGNSRAAGSGDGSSCFALGG